MHVVYGILGLKTHSKTTLVVRKEQDSLRCYAHIGTGNYHVQTARLYTDISLLTCRTDLTEDLVDMYHYLTGRSLKREYRKLLVAPVNMAQGFLALIEKEIANRAAGKPARIIAKMNSMEDHAICKALYRASQAGVPMDLIVRGFCCLRPGVAGIEREHPGDLGHRAVPGALARLPLRVRLGGPAPGRSSTSAPRTGCTAISRRAWKW